MCANTVSSSDPLLKVLLPECCRGRETQPSLPPLAIVKQIDVPGALARRLVACCIAPVVDQFVQSLNMMQERQEESFKRLSDFPSDLAHELRTPVGNMLMQTQVPLSKPRTAEQYHEILYSNAEEFTRLSRMMSDMLFLAKADHGLVAPFNDAVYLEQEVRDLFSFFELLAEGKQVTLEVDGKGSVSGDRELLRRAISNVLSNAIRHTIEGGCVRVGIDCQAEGGSGDRH